MVDKGYVTRRKQKIADNIIAVIDKIADSSKGKLTNLKILKEIENRSLPDYELVEKRKRGTHKLQLCKGRLSNAQETCPLDPSALFYPKGRKYCINWTELQI